MLVFLVIHTDFMSPEFIFYWNDASRACRTGN